MQDFFGSVRQSLVFKPSPSGDENVSSSFGGFVEKIGSSIRKSKIGMFSKPSVHALPAPARAKKEAAGAQIRWRKGELIGCGAFGRVYMGMNLDSGELLAVKQVSVVVNTASKDKTQDNYMEGALTVRNLLQEFHEKHDDVRYPTILGLREHIFPGRLFHLTRGGVSKAFKIINLSEDIFAGFNSTLRKGNVTRIYTTL